VARKLTVGLALHRPCVTDLVPMQLWSRSPFYHCYELPNASRFIVVVICPCVCLCICDLSATSMPCFDGCFHEIFSVVQRAAKMNLNCLVPVKHRYTVFSFGIGLIVTIISSYITRQCFDAFSLQQLLLPQFLKVHLGTQRNLG